MTIKHDNIKYVKTHTLGNILRKIMRVLVCYCLYCRNSVVKKAYFKYELLIKSARGKACGLQQIATKIFKNRRWLRQRIQNT